MRIIIKNKTFIEAEFGFGLIDEAIQEGIEISKKYSLPVLFTFNGINVKCQPNSSLGDVKKEFRLIQDANRIDYKNSKEYFLSEEKYYAKNKSEQDTLDDNLKNYYMLDFNNCKDVLLWFKDNLYYLDNINVKFNRNEILQPLFDVGYTPNMCTNKNYDGSFLSQELWIIGQIMSCAHPILVNKIEELYKIKRK